MNELEPRCLLSVADLTTAAQVTAVTGATAIVQAVSNAYAIQSSAARVNFVASDPDHPGSTPVTHFQVTNLATGASSTGTGNATLLTTEGIYSVQYWSTDSDDSEAPGAHSILIGLDRTGPSISESATPNVLWPPNGKFVTVTVSGTATDTLTGINPASLSFHVVDEYGAVQPSGPVTVTSVQGPTAFGGDTLVRFSFQVQLQARRHGYDFDGRQYTIVVDGWDRAGNPGESSTVVTVPHDMGNHFGRPERGVRRVGQGPLPGSPTHFVRNRPFHRHFRTVRPIRTVDLSGRHRGLAEDNPTRSRRSLPTVGIGPVVLGPGAGRGNGNDNGNHGDENHGNGNHGKRNHDNGHGNGKGHGG